MKMHQSLTPHKFHIQAKESDPNDKLNKPPNPLQQRSLLPNVSTIDNYSDGKSNRNTAAKFGNSSDGENKSTNAAKHRHIMQGMRAVDSHHTIKKRCMMGGQEIVACPTIPASLKSSVKENENGGKKTINNSTGDLNNQTLANTIDENRATKGPGISACPTNLASSNSNVKATKIGGRRQQTV